MIGQPIRPSQIITEKSVENALRMLLALGGSTNAIVHLHQYEAGSLHRVKTLVSEFLADIVLNGRGTACGCEHEKKQ